jgi:hypothetical protein
MKTLAQINNRVNNFGLDVSSDPEVYDRRTSSERRFRSGQPQAAVDAVPVQVDVKPATGTTGLITPGWDLQEDRCTRWGLFGHVDRFPLSVSELAMMR